MYQSLLPGDQYGGLVLSVACLSPWYIGLHCCRGHCTGNIVSFPFAFKISLSFGVVTSEIGCAGGFTVGENMRLLIVDELLSAVKYPSGHHSWFDTTAGIDTFAFGLCLLTRGKSRMVAGECLQILARVLEI